MKEFLNNIQTWDYWIEIISSTAISSGFLLLIGKFYIDFIAKRRLEKFKHNLEMIKLNYQIQFSSLHKDRAEIIVKIYQSLTSLEMKLVRIVSHDFHTIEIFSKIMSSIGENVVQYNDLVHYNRIYFSSKTCKNLDEINNNLKLITEVKLTAVKTDKNIEFDKISWAEFLDILNSTTKNIFTIKLSIEDMFRELLGVELK